MSLVEAVGDVGTGLALLAGGAVAWSRVRDSGTGPLLLLAGVTWLAGDLVDPLVHAHRGPLVHALLAFPGARPRSRALAVLVLAAYVDGLVPSVAGNPWATLALAAGLALAGTARLVRPGASRLRPGRAVAGCSVALAAPLAHASVTRLVGGTPGLVPTALFEGAVVLTAVVLVAELVGSRSVGAATTGLVVQLAQHQEPQALRDVLARVIGDPGLAVAFRVGDPADPDAWIDEAGQPVTLPDAARDDRLVTLVEDAGAPVAALVHDPLVLRDEDLASSVAAAVRLLLANVRLQAEDAARTRELAASRRRLVEAGDDERRRIGEQLHTGAERMLAEAAADLATASTVTASLTGLREELDAAAADLARFARGVHPLVLTERGLAAALEEMAARASVPVTVHAPTVRFPAAQETAAYFVCSEALANVAKHAPGARVRLDVAGVDDHLAVRVSDDGPGGAEESRGSGLRGLRDRVEALGGRWELTSHAGGGTRLDAALPLADAGTR